MKPIQVLMDEHRSIERVLDALETAAAGLEAGLAVRPGFFLDAAQFLVEFADGCHHRKEEGILFPAMIDSGMPPQGGPIAVMLAEHESGRSFVRAIRAAATRLASGETEVAGRLVRSARDYVALLRDHIDKEDEVLFPMAASRLSAEAGRKVAAEFDRAEASDAAAGQPARLLELAAALAAEADGLASGSGLR